MGLNERLCAAVTPIVSVCVPERYEAAAGETPAEEYCTYNYFDRAMMFANGRPRRIVRDYQLHYVLPSGTNPEPTKQRLLYALVCAGFAVAGIQDASETDKDDADIFGAPVQHWVFEFQGREEIRYGDI